ncbi:hypothetical protein ACFP9V_18750 [Deinococcus radiopugnans]|uniref:hypothetical protein n=1 Tax=Deinococcus radiopugnans TaxID=57497 RepID=UPI003621061F
MLADGSGLGAAVAASEQVIPQEPIEFATGMPQCHDGELQRPHGRPSPTVARSHLEAGPFDRVGLTGDVQARPRKTFKNLNVGQPATSAIQRGLKSQHHSAICLEQYELNHVLDCWRIDVRVKRIYVVQRSLRVPGPD